MKPEFLKNLKVGDQPLTQEVVDPSFLSEMSLYDRVVFFVYSSICLR